MWVEAPNFILFVFINLTDNYFSERRGKIMERRGYGGKWDGAVLSFQILVHLVYISTYYIHLLCATAYLRARNHAIPLV